MWFNVNSHRPFAYPNPQRFLPEISHISYPPPSLPKIYSVQDQSTLQQSIIQSTYNTHNESTSLPPIPFSLLIQTNKTGGKKIVDPQNATLTNIEVLSHITTHPPRRPPNPPPNTNTRNFIPSPDLRDHNTVIKEIHNYVTRLAPHLLSYPRFTNDSVVEGEDALGNALVAQGRVGQRGQGETPMDNALRELVRRLQPFGLTKGEALMIVNLGVGVQRALGVEEQDQDQDQEQGQGQDQGMEGAEGQEHEQGEGVNGTAQEEGHMDVDVDNNHEVNGVVVDERQGEGEGEGEGGDEGEGGEIAEEDYGALALLDTVIEEREERLSNEDVAQVLGIIRETLGNGQ